MNKPMYKQKYRLSYADITKIGIWLNDNRERLEPLSRNDLQATVKEELEIDINGPTLTKLRSSLGWVPFRSPKTKKLREAEIIRVHMADWEHRLKKLEEEVALLKAVVSD